MLKKLFPILFIALCACANATPSVSTPEADPRFPYHGITLDSLGTYEATFLLQFEGEKPYIYIVGYRSDGNSVERSLHIEGVETDQNPGDIRMVTQEGINYMSGPGTDGECLIFPTSLDIGPAFLLPDQLISPSTLTTTLRDLGEDTLEGLPTRRYGLRKSNLAGWKDASIDIWVTEPEGETLRYDLQLSGPDPFFDHGSGHFSGQFAVLSLEPQSIEPVTGCDIELPIPESVENLVRFPGLLAFDRTGTLELAAAFYQEYLPQSGWVQTEEPTFSGDSLILSYHKGADSLEIVIELVDDRIHVELLTGT